MKELKLYVCEVCGTQYADRANAKVCEKSHKVPQRISGCKYLSRKQDQSGYPQKISVIFDDGKSVDYRR